MHSNATTIFTVNYIRKISLSTYKHYDDIIGIPNRSKTTKNSVTVHVPPGGSSSAARRFMEKTQKQVKLHVPPGGSSYAAIRFLEKSRRRDPNQN